MRREDTSKPNLRWKGTGFLEENEREFGVLTI